MMADLETQGLAFLCSSGNVTALCTRVVRPTLQSHNPDTHLGAGWSFGHSLHCRLGVGAELGGSELAEASPNALPLC